MDETAAKPPSHPYYVFPFRSRARSGLSIVCGNGLLWASPNRVPSLRVSNVTPHAEDVGMHQGPPPVWLPYGPPTGAARSTKVSRMRKSFLERGSSSTVWGTSIQERHSSAGML